MVAFVVRNRGAHSSFYFSHAIGRPVIEAAQVLLGDSAGHKGSNLGKSCARLTTWKYPPRCD
jgi:hypothetical protein